MSAGEKPTKCERCGFLPRSEPVCRQHRRALDKDGLCHECAHVMSFALFVQVCDPEMRWHFLSDLFEAIETFDELDAEEAKADTAEADA